MRIIEGRAQDSGLSLFLRVKVGPAYPFRPLLRPSAGATLRAMSETNQFRVIRDPLWNTIRLDPTAVRIIDTAEFQRLRYIRQLGFAHLVYPGATHTRFDHAVGVYHLARTALRFLKEREPVPEEVWEGEELIPYAALLHDIGHFAFSHALEELEPETDSRGPRGGELSVLPVPGAAGGPGASRAWGAGHGSTS